MFKTCRYIRISHSDALSKQFHSIIVSGSLIILNFLFCRRQKNNEFRYKNNTIMEPDLKKISSLSVVRGCWPGDNILSPTTLCLLGVVHWIVSLVSKFSVKHPNCLITLHIKKICKVNCDFMRISSSNSYFLFVCHKINNKCH